MKTIKNIFLLMILSSVGMVMSCGSDGSSGPSDLQRFVGPWTATTVRLDNVDVTNPEYSDFRITFNDDGSYITIDGDPVFTDTGGFWEITSTGTSSLTIDMDGVPVVASFSEDFETLTLSFTANDAVIGARTTGLIGEYVFTLSK